VADDEIVSPSALNRGTDLANRISSRISCEPTFDRPACMRDKSLALR